MTDPVHLDKKHLWHPFTPNDVWLDPAFEPVVIERGEGSTLTDTKGRHYLDGNSSIWVNLHGHGRAEINDAIREQLGRIAHSSFLGLSNDLAPALGARLCGLAGMDRCFFGDDGSTAMEAALKIAWQYFQQNGQPNRTNFLSLRSAYHGDTVGAMSLGHSPVFHHSYRGLLFTTLEIDAPCSYHSPHNTRPPVRGESSRLRTDCLGAHLEALAAGIAGLGDTLAGFIIEPRVQGAAGFFMHPEGYLREASRMVRAAGGLVILDEVMTGFGRTGPLFAFQKEGIRPDLVALAKGLTGGYLPLAATLTTEELFQGFGGDRSKTFFHGHSYTANQLGCAAALASLDLLDSLHTEAHRTAMGETLGELGQKFWDYPSVGDVRREGTILAIELVEDFATRRPFDPARRLGAGVCEQARHHGLLTRPVGDVLLLMPPYCTTESELKQMTTALYEAIGETSR